MVSIMKSLNAFDELIEEVSAHKITFAAKASVERLKDATEDLRTFFNENPGDRLAIQHKYNTANTYALQVEYFLCMSNGECNRRYKERENAKALYALARQLLHGYADGGKDKDSREYFLLVDYVGVAQKYLIASENFVIDMTDDMKDRVEEMSKYIISITKHMNGITVEEYNARSEEARKNEEMKRAVTNNTEKSISGEEVTDNEPESEESNPIEILGLVMVPETPDNQEPVVHVKPAPTRSILNDYEI